MTVHTEGEKGLVTRQMWCQREWRLSQFGMKLDVALEIVFWKLGKLSVLDKTMVIGWIGSGVKDTL